MLLLKRLVPCLSIMVFIACSDAPSPSQTKDIFALDAKNPNRRRHAKPEEMQWTIDLDRCTGSLIAPEIMLTASHCRMKAGETFTSGGALAKGEEKDITVLEILEENNTLDFALVKIEWKEETPPAVQKITPLFATATGDFKIGEEEDEGDEAFTVGFPTDLDGPTYAEGRLKEIKKHKIYYNIGVINGNSGGALWRKSDYMLLGLTNGGPKRYGEDGWDNNDVNDSKHWNHGVGAWAIFENSEVVRELYPKGKRLTSR